MAYETEYSQHALKNGLRVVVAARPWARTFAAALAFDVGWRDEPQAQAGIAHLIEHLAFCGANREVADGLERQGLYLNAQTEVERTQFQLSGHTSLMEEGFSFLSRTLDNLPCDPRTVEQELQILEHEIAFTAESPVDMEMRKLTARIIGDRNFGRDVLTTVKGMRQLTPAAAEKFHHAWFTPSNARLTVVSPVPTQELLPQLERTLGAVSDRNAQRPGRTRQPVQLPPLLTIAAPGDYVQVLLLQHYAPASLHPIHGIVLLADLLGGGPYSLLFRAIRDEARLAYNVGSNFTFMSDCVLTDLFAVVPKKAAPRALEKMLEILNAVRSGQLAPEVFDQTRARLIRSLDLYEDNPLELCNFLNDAPAQQDLTLLTPRYYRERLAVFTLAEAKGVFADVLKTERRVGVLLGPTGWLTRWRARRLLTQRA